MAQTLLAARDATRPFPERKWSLPSGSRQGFLTSGSSAQLRDLPNLLPRPVVLFVQSQTIAGTQWREPCGLHTRFPCHPLRVPATVNRDPFGSYQLNSVQILKRSTAADEMAPREWRHSIPAMLQRQGK
jgi:hypothetical protein